LLLFVLSAYATTPTTSVASLKGLYTFQLAGARQNSFSATVICGGQPTFISGNDTRSEVVAGTINFSGTGSATGTFTQYGHFNQTASDASVTCTGGNAVYDAPASGTLTATYTVQSNSVGAMILTPSGGVGNNNPNNFVMRLAGACSAGISNTIFLISLKGSNAVEIAGIARFQGTC
jgi:hypothetical protein